MVEAEAGEAIQSAKQCQIRTEVLIKCLVLELASLAELTELSSLKGGLTI